jgi:hypothetical protein
MAEAVLAEQRVPENEHFRLRHAIYTRVVGDRISKSVARAAAVCVLVFCRVVSNTENFSFKTRLQHSEPADRSLHFNLYY